MSGDPSFPAMRIIAYSDYYDIPDRKVWGDYWLKENLSREFRKAGCAVGGPDCGVLLHLFGEPLPELPSDTYNILWIHSHPDWITPEILAGYHKIYCISRHFSEKIREWGFDAETLMVPTNMTPVVSEKKYDIVFVGNTKNNSVRKVIRDLGPARYNVKIWGWGWKGLIPDEWYGGEYYENGKLNELYAASRITLNDHHDDMAREGFLNPRILDILAGGGFVISDRIKGLEEIFGDSVPVYDTAEELGLLVGRFMRQEAERGSLASKGRQIALRHTFAAVCRKIMGHIESVSDTLFLWRDGNNHPKPQA